MRQLLSIWTAGFVLSISAAAAGTLIPVPLVPGSTGMYLFGINDTNVLAGSYFDAEGDEHGFFGTLDGQYQTFDVGNGGTEARAISNDGTITGLSNTDDGVFTLLQFERLPDGTIKKIKKSGSQLIGVVGHLANPTNKFVGDDADPNTGIIHGYLGLKGKYKSEVTLPFGTPDHVRPRGINSAGTISGFFSPYPNNHGFVFLQNGDATQIDYPDADAVGTQLGAINDQGVALGAWNDADGAVHTFTFDTTSGVFTPFKVKGAASVSIADINSAGFIDVNTDIGNFVYCPLKKKQCPKAGVTPHTQHH